MVNTKLKNMYACLNFIDLYVCKKKDLIHIGMHNPDFQNEIYTVE